MPGSSTLTSPLDPPFERLDDPRVGTVLAERYRIDALLGEGGMGRVYAAEHVLMRKKLAVKVLHRELTTVPEVVQRFEREAMAAANIDHPNVAAATDFGKLPDGAVFLVLEYVQGKNLRDEIAAGPLGVERALHIGRQIASALGSAHALDIVHRDLKPENVMLVEKSGDPDFAKVLDFGIAKVPIGETSSGAQRAHSPITKVGMVFGTPEYMAPEQALGQPVDGRADLYALGVIIYEMISGVRPFSSKSQVGILGQQLSKPPPRFVERAPGILVSPPVEQVILRLLAKDVTDRFPNAGEVVESIDALLGAPLTRGGRRFTQLSGSPASARRSNPGWQASEGVPSPEPPLVIQATPAPPLPQTLIDRGSDSGQERRAAAEPPSRQTQRISHPEHSFAHDLAFRSADPSIPERLAPTFTDDPTERAGGGIRSPLERASHWIDVRRAALPGPIARALHDVPAPALLVTALVLLFGILTALVIAVTHREQAMPVASTHASPVASVVPEATPAAAATELRQSEIDAAKMQGTAALEALASRYPKDPRVLLELVGLYDSGGLHAQAVGAIGRALSADANLRDNEQIATALFKAAQARGSADASFALLEAPMQSRGADIIYDLATTNGVRPQVKQRAEAWLRTKDFDRASSAALNVAVSLRYADACPQKYALLLRAKNVGDDRSLPYLREWRTKTGCGRRHREDCSPCLRKDDRLEQAIHAIEARSKPG